MADRRPAQGRGEFRALAGTRCRLLMLHGGGAMRTLLLLGALVPLHVQRAWRDRKNRATGATMVALNVLLVVTAFGLYYAGSDVVRPWISDLHIVVGTILPALFVVHVLLGRRMARRRQSG